MTDNYSQAVDILIERGARRLQWIGIFAVLFSLGFVMISIFYNWLFMIAFALVLAIGIVCIYKYNRLAKEYIYEFSKTCLTFVKKDVVNRQSVVCRVAYTDVKAFEIMNEGYFENDNTRLYCSKAYDMGVYQLRVDVEGKEMKILFAPDDYMIALINEAIKENTAIEA